MAKYKLDKSKISVSIAILAVIGVFIVISAALEIGFAVFSANAERHEAVVSDVKKIKNPRTSAKSNYRGSSYRLTLYYTAAGSVHTLRLSYSTLLYTISGLSKGKTVAVYCKPDAPDKPRYDPIYEIISFLPFTVMLFIIALPSLGKEMIKGKKINNLIKNKKVFAADSWHEENSKVKKGGVRYKQVICNVKHDKKSYSFKSRLYSSDKCPFTRDKPLFVAVDLNDTKTYYIYQE